jgi:hypothetical protein
MELLRNMLPHHAQFGSKTAETDSLLKNFKGLAQSFHQLPPPSDPSSNAQMAPHLDTVDRQTGRSASRILHKYIPTFCPDSILCCYNAARSDQSAYHAAAEILSKSGNRQSQLGLNFGGSNLLNDI